MLKKLALISVIATLATSAWAGNYTADQIVSKFQANGYKRILVTRTLFGNTKIKGEIHNRTHEIVLSKDGQVLENFLEGRGYETQRDLDEMAALPDDTDVNHSQYSPPANPTNEGSSPGGPGRPNDHDLASNDPVTPEDQEDVDSGGSGSESVVAPR